MRFRIAAALAALALATPAVSQPDVVRRVSPAVAVLRVYDAAGQAIAQGSGFFVSDGRLVTNAHVVAGGARVEILSADGRLLGAVDHASNLSASIDVALLPRLGSVPASLPLAAAPPEVGERVLVIGAPQGLENTVADGLVSAYRTLEGRRFMQISAPISSGSSGGPILNQSGEVVGVAVAIYRDGQNLNFAVPLDELRALALSPGGRQNFPPANSQAIGSASLDQADPDTITWRSFQVGGSLNGELTAADHRIGGYQLPYDYVVLEGRAGQTVRLTVQPRAGGRPFLMVGRMQADTVAWFAVDTSYVPSVTTTIPPNGALEMRIVARRGTGGEYTVQAYPATPTVQSDDDREAADGWEHVSTSQNGDVRSYINPSRIQVLSGGYVQAWVRSRQTARPSNGNYDTGMMLEQFDCTRRRYALVQGATYRNGRVTESFAPSSYLEYEYVIPDTVAETLLNRVCNLAGL